MISKKEYQQIVKNKSKGSKVFVNCLIAFLVGGAICTLGQILVNLYVFWGADMELAKTLNSISLIFLGVLFTAIGCYDDLAKHAGAGTLVPITGFANAVSSAAIEFKTEGMITGLGIKMFIVAGPIIVYGVSASILYGLILWGLSLFGIQLY